MSNKRIFIGANLCNIEKKIDERSCVLIGSMLVTIKVPKNHIKVPQVFPMVYGTFLSSSTPTQVHPITKSLDMEIPIQFGHGFVQPDMSRLY